MQKKNKFMENLYIQATKKTPEIDFRTDGNLSIKRKSYIENTKDFYDSIINWLKQYIKEPAEKTVINFELEYFNTSSQLWLFRIVETLQDLVKINKDITFNWYFADEEIEEVGADLANLLNVKINFIRIESPEEI